jgi:hypothetical protein
MRINQLSAFSERRKATHDRVGSEVESRKRNLRTEVR